MKLIVKLCFAALLLYTYSISAQNGNLRFSQSYYLRKAENDENSSKQARFQLKATIPGDFSNFDNDTLLGVVIGEHNLFQNLGEDTVEKRFNSIKEATELGEDSGLTKTKINTAKGKGQIRAFIRKERNIESDNPRYYDVEKVTFAWNSRSLKVTANYNERVLTSENFMISTFPFDYTTLTQFDVPTMTATMKPIIIYFGDSIYMAKDVVISGPCKFTRESELHKLNATAKKIPLEQQTGAKVNLDIAELNELVDADTEVQGTLMPSGDIMVPQNEPFYIKATVSDGFSFNGWSADANATFADSSEESTTVTVVGASNISASILKEVKMTMAVSPANNGTTSPIATSVTTVKSEVAQTIKATPNDGYVFLYWTLTGTGTIADPNALETTTILYKDSTLTANFAVEKYLLSLETSPADGSGGSTNPGAGEYEVGKETAFSISATTKDGYYFKGWTITNGTGTIEFEKSANTTVSLQSDATVTANFEATTTGTATLTMAVGTDGTGTTNPGAGTYTINTGEPQAVTAVAATNYTFSHWTITGSATVDDNNSETTAVTIFGDATLTAVFTAK